MEWYLKVVRDNYANFEGRARRKEYWMFYLFQMLFLIGLVFIGVLVSGNSSNEFPAGLILVLIYFLGTFIPTLAVTVRRLHDTGKSGWYYLVSFIPYIGGIWLFVLTVIEGDKGSSKYGLDPKGGNFEEIDEIGKPLLD